MDHSNLLHDLPAGVCIARSGIVVFANATFAQARGTTPEAILHSAFDDLLHDGDRTMIMQSLERALQAEKSHHTMYNVPHPHLGSRRMYGSFRSIGSETLIIVEHPLGQLDSSQVQHDAITTYQQLAISNSNDGIWVWNVPEQSVILLGNFLASLGYEPSDIQTSAEWALSLIHPDDVDATPTDFEPYRTGERKEWRTESRFRSKNGSWVWTLVRGRVIQWSEDGQPIVMIGSHVNIDDLKRAEQSLVRRNEVLSTISSANNHYVMGNDPLLAFQEILDALLRSTHAQRGMLAGVRDIDDQRRFVIHATNNPEPELAEYQRAWHPIPDAIIVALEKNTTDIAPIVCTKDLQFILGCADDQCVSRILPVRSGSDVVGFVALCFASVATVHFEDAIVEPLLATYASLIVSYRSKIEESRVRDELARRRSELERTNAELEHANTMKDTFLANMSHELRSPLSTVIGVTEALTDGIYGQVTLAQRECISDAREAAQHLLSLINDLLDLSRARLGEIDLYVEEYHIEDLLRSTLSIMRALAHRKGINLEFSMPNQRVVLLGDVRRIKQVFVNLMSNAIKFTPQGGYVAINVKPDRDGKVVRIDVEDDGIGIPEEQIRHVFEPFIQLDSRLSRQHEGTGLGLPIVQRIVDLHGGVVEVRSILGKGCTFTVVLPWEDMQQTIFEHHVAPNEAIPTARSGSVEHGLLYIVDDNAMNRRLLRGYAEQEGFRVDEFANGQACLDALIVRESPDIIVMDIQMPGMDGLETMRRIRATERREQHIPIVALTALVMPGDRELCLAAGADHYVTKPVEYREFTRELVALVASTTLQPPAAPSDS